MMESPRHDLDAAIDRVAATLVEVRPDDQLLTRALASLPERSASPWFLRLQVQAAAAAALLLLAWVYASPSREQDPAAPLPVAARVSPAEAPLVAPRAASAAIPTRQSLIPDPRSPIPHSPDHDYGLPPVGPLPALVLESMEPVALHPEAVTTLAPLVVTELTVADESSPREQK